MTDKDVTELPDDPAQLKNVIRQKLAEIPQREHHLGLALKSKYGPKREHFDAAQSTQCDWMRQLAELSRPVVDRIAERIRQGEIIWTDDTTVPVLDRAQSKTKIGWFWVYIGDREHRYAVFDPNGDANPNTTVTIVPEPTSGALIGLGALFTALRMRSWQVE